MPAYEVEFEEKPGDMALFVSDGVPVIRAPQHEDGPVPEDFLVLLGVATAFNDDRFRAMMLGICRDAHDNGYLTGIIHGPDEGRPN
jgi:hypothetical protein